MRELEHKRQADSLWQQKLERLRREREMEEEERRKIVMDEDEKKEIIERERRRLLEQYAPYVSEYLPKGTLRDEDEAMLVRRQR
jgi:hypothetical protein|mmetsp:Transcript_22836/g.3751  ORF Transcript_22836/g.3751 Transcript_22836/m.3751 type:complete len:84 (+) Transcript_22836:939-1190(+)|eukprot:CAMPEP_0168316450 /NCGR_PEP_ID=MMETSP0210-20121227/15511_1 /TAXON_ID=40633 /ORGANISM="Condylostoma magnum, Strain COL2" /LENGTH=83 /DNA_ID=CAMNT_0008297135 /DNA_START=939 /DNA_END=1190 /DNA_ORIENTATION=+